MQTPNILPRFISLISWNSPALPGIRQAAGSRAVRKLLWSSAFVMLLAVTSLAQNTFVYTNDDVFNGNTVSGFAVASNGVLTPIPGSPFSTGGAGNGGSGFFAATRVTISTAGKFLYAGNSGSSTISAFSVNPVTGFLSPVPGSPFAAGGSAAGFGYSLAVTPSNMFLFCANNDSNTISAFSIAANGSLTPVPGSPFPAGGATDGIRVSPDGRFLSVAFLQTGPSGSVAMFSIASNGVLAAVPGSPFLGAGQGEITGIDMNCAGNLLFASEALFGPSVVNVFSVSPNGGLSPIAGSPFTFSGSNSNVPFLSPNGKLLFVSNQFSNNFVGSITVLDVAANGSLTEVAGSPFANPGGFEPTIIETDAAGRFLFAANDFHSISVFSVASNGTLTPAPGSPFPSGQSGGLISLAVFPGKSCGSSNTFNTCMRDNTSGDVFAFDSTTGAYQYTRCSDGFSINGTGAVRSIGGVLSLTDNKVDRRISAGFLTGQLSGNATVMLSVAPGVWQTFTVHDTTSFGTGCSCR